MIEESLDGLSTKRPAPMLPIVIPEEFVSSFKYWHEGIQVGMTYRNELYAKIKVYSLDKRLEAYEYSCQLAGSGGTTLCITVSKSGYTLWQSLRTLPLPLKASLPPAGASLPTLVPC